MKSVYFLTFSILALGAFPVQANTAEIANPQWEEIPDLVNEPPLPSAYFNANGIIQNEDSIVYDLVALDGSYTRLETNCATGESRHLRQGFFETRTRVNFGLMNSDWYADEKGTGVFVCNYIETL